MKNQNVADRFEDVPQHGPQDGASCFGAAAIGTNMSKKMARLSATVATGRVFRGKVKPQAKRRADLAFVYLLVAFLPLLAAFGAAFLW